VDRRTANPKESGAQAGRWVGDPCPALINKSIVYEETAG
jgi:hypothetical protein